MQVGDVFNSYEFVVQFINLGIILILNVVWRQNDECHVAVVAIAGRELTATTTNSY